MPNNLFARTEMLLGAEALEKLKNSKILVFGVGGVGGYVCEALARCGVGEIDVVDKDTVDETNINRQIIADTTNIGMPKVDAVKERMQRINPEIKVNVFKTFFLPENADFVDFSNYDYIVDAVDTVSAKIEIVKRAKENSVPVISAMGTGNKINPQMLEVADIQKTSVCPLAKAVRLLCRKNGIKHLKTVYSKEIPIKKEENGRTPGSISFVPSSAGLLIASEIVKDITGIRND